MGTNHHPTLAQLRKMLAQIPGVNVGCTDGKYYISTYDKSAKSWKQHPQPDCATEREAICKALEIHNR